MQHAFFCTFKGEERDKGICSCSPVDIGICECRRDGNSISLSSKCTFDGELGCIVNRVFGKKRKSCSIPISSVSSGETWDDAMLDVDPKLLVKSRIISLDSSEEVYDGTGSISCSSVSRYSSIRYDCMLASS